MDGAAGPTADPPHNYQANDLSDYFRHCLCDAIRYKMLLYDQVNPNQLHVTAAATAAAPAETTQAAAPAGPAPAPAVTANQAPQVQPSTEGQINMAPTLTAEQQALVAALSPETIATLLALAQAAGSLPKPAASTTSSTMQQWLRSILDSPLLSGLESHRLLNITWTLQYYSILHAI